MRKGKHVTQIKRLNSRKIQVGEIVSLTDIEFNGVDKIKRATKS